MFDENDRNVLRTIRADMLRMVHRTHASHIGSALSVVDALYCIYSRVADINKDNIRGFDRDRVILSKGHASIALYAVLANLGLMDKARLEEYYSDGGTLPAHLDMNAAEGVDCSAGSLGHGLPIAIGMALANPKRRVFVILGDGEMDEGSVWEGILFLSKHHLSNLHILIDFNGLQGSDKVCDVVDFSRLGEILQGFSLDCKEVDGHDLDQIEDALRAGGDMAHALILRTVKGKGVSFMENRLEWHYKSPDDSQLDAALKELGV